ncbi:hypothetical protein FACS189459_2630 [Bacilli bacterium]|nr:hypothetical protein FACS189459_2630 [Bacilli bacterium]GHU52234.1 hypothetical protein FACS189496_2040 [Bacilli bacterium]
MDLITKNYKETIIKCKNNKNCHGDMLIIHGFGTNHWHLYKLALKLSENFNIYLIDLPGHGDNIDGFNKKHMKITFFVEYVIEYIKHKQFKNLFLMGHSMGGGICCGVASIIPETIKKLILICPANPGSIAAGPKLLKMFFPKTWQDNLKFQKLLYHPNNYENFIKDEVWLKNHNDNFL